MKPATSPLRVLVTRPREDAVELVRRLGAEGIEIVEEPLLEIRYEEGPAPALERVQGLIFTSANGVRAFARRSDERTLPVFAVGDATARKARDLGFQAVESAGGNVDDLVALVLDRISPNSGKLLHVAGSVVAGNLSSELAAAGFAVDRHVMYDARAAERLSTRTISLLQRGEVDAVLLFSPRTARTFVGLLKRYGMVECCGPTVACCLSEAVAREVGELEWQLVLVAREPTLEALLDVLNEVR